MALKEIKLTPQLNNRVELDRTNRIIELTESSGGIPYVELSNITVADQYKNSHVKTLTGIYTGGRPTRIKVRDHYPHSIGTAWCRLSNLLTAETTSGRVNVAGTQEFISNTFLNNYSCLKETCFYGAVNTLITVGDIEVASSMRYDTIEPYAPEESATYYYGDRISTVGVVYPYGSTPSLWQYATIDYKEQTWEVEITLNQFTLFEGTAYQQTSNYWKPYNASTYPKGLNYDPRLHAVEVDITSSYNGETIHGKRIYYIWHIPQAWPLMKAPQIELTTGIYSGPFDHHICGGGLGAQYDTGYTASGGIGKIELQKNDTKYENLLYQLYPSIPIDTTNLLVNPVKACRDSSGNFYVISDPNYLNDRIVKKFDNEQNYVSYFAAPQAGDMVCVDDYLYIGKWCNIGKYDLSGNLLKTIGSSGSGDGQFNMDSPMVEIYNNFIWGLEDDKLQWFDSVGTFIDKITKPTGIYYFVDFCFDDDGNIYITASDTSYNAHLLMYDNEKNLIYNINYGHVSHSDINYYGGYLYINGNHIVDPEEETYIYGVVKFDLEGNYISTYEIDIIGLNYIDVDGNFYLSINGYNKISVYSQSWTLLFDIGTKNDGDKYIERNIRDNGGIWDLTQLKKAYAVVGPSGFDPTNSSTYTAMTEYTGEDFSNITLTSGGLLRFKNLYPTTTTHYIYVIANLLPVGETEIHYSYCSWQDSAYGCTSGLGNQRSYLWFTRTPSCTEIPAGSATQYCNQYYSFEEIMTDDRTIEVNLDNFDTGVDLNTATYYYYWLYWCRVHLFVNGSDGGRTKFWIAFNDDGVKKNYNNINDATNIPVLGTGTALNYRKDDYFYLGTGMNYGWDLGSIKLINRTIKNGSYLTAGFGENYNVERIAT